METKSRVQANGTKRSHVADAASDLLNESKKLAHELYADSLDKVLDTVGDVQHEAKEYSDALLKKVKENPLSSILIAGGVGFLLSLLVKK